MALIEEIVTVTLTLEQTGLARKYAQRLLDARVAAGGKAGGVSRIRSFQDRQDKLFQDACVGQLGQLGATLYLTGSDRAYIQSRDLADANPLKGDRGSDFPGIALDIKSSFIKLAKNSYTYALHVRPAERHQKSSYVLATVGSDFSSNFSEETVVSLVGWAYDADFPSLPVGEGIFAGAYRIDRYALQPMYELKKLMDSLPPFFQNVS